MSPFFFNLYYPYNIFSSIRVSSLTQVDVEDGHTLHLVVRQPDLPPPGSLPNHAGLMQFFISSLLL